MRPIKIRELEIINYLKAFSAMDFSISPDQLVWEVNPEMKSIRADYCKTGCPVNVVAVCEFDDSDGVPVVVSLLLTRDHRFGELDFWKVTDEPLVGLPSSNKALRGAHGVKAK